jgi:hypothetical protein
VNQAQRMNSAGNAWEADPWNASDSIADHQLAGFEERSNLPLKWVKLSAMLHQDGKLFGMESEWHAELDIEFCSVHNDEDLVLMQLIWHGFPDPPEWRLASRPSGQYDSPWESWGYFADLPKAWEFSKDTNA